MAPLRRGGPRLQADHAQGLHIDRLAARDAASDEEERARMDLEFGFDHLAAIAVDRLGADFARLMISS